MSKRRKFSAAFKTKVVLESLSQRYTIRELAQKYQIHPNQITKWKTEFLAAADQIFKNGKESSSKRKEQAEKERLLKIIGEQKVEIEFLKKSLS